MRGSLKLNLSRRRLQGAKKTYCARVPQLRRIRLRNILVIFDHWRSIFYSLRFMILCCFPPEIYVIPPQSPYFSMSRSPYALKNLTFLHSFISTWFTFFYVYVKSIFRPNHYFLLKKWTGVWTVSVLTWRKMALTHACSLLTTTFITSASFYTVPWDGNTPWSLLTKKHWQLRHVRTCQMSLFN